MQLRARDSKPTADWISNRTWTEFMTVLNIGAHDSELFSKCFQKDHLCLGYVLRLGVSASRFLAVWLAFALDILHPANVPDQQEPDTARLVWQQLQRFLKSSENSDQDVPTSPPISMMSFLTWFILLQTWPLPIWVRSVTNGKDFITECLSSKAAFIALATRLLLGCAAVVYVATFVWFPLYAYTTDPSDVTAYILLIPLLVFEAAALALAWYLSRHSAWQSLFLHRTQVDFTIPALRCTKTSSLFSLMRACILLPHLRDKDIDLGNKDGKAKKLTQAWGVALLISILVYFFKVPVLQQLYLTPPLLSSASSCASPFLTLCPASQLPASELEQNPAAFGNLHFYCKPVS